MTMPTPENYRFIHQFAIDITDRLGADFTATLEEIRIRSVPYGRPRIALEFVWDCGGCRGGAVKEFSHMDLNVCIDDRTRADYLEAVMGLIRNLHPLLSQECGRGQG